MTNGTRKDGTGETLRGVAAIVVAGIALGLVFNALGLASRPPRGLPWITPAEKKMPSLEELQPGSGLVPAPVRGPGFMRGFALVGTAWAQESAAPAGATDLGCTPPAPPARTAAKPAVVPKSTAAVKPAVVAKSTAAAKPAVTPRKQTPVTAKPLAKPVTPAPAAAAPPAPAKVAVPFVPDLDQPIEVKLPNVKRFFDAGGAVFVDAREAPEFAAGHIAGALSLPFEDVVKNPALIEPFKKAGKPLILYCGSADCDLSHALATNLVAEGVRKVLVFTDGLVAWKAAGYPVETGVAKAVR